MSFEDFLDFKLFITKTFMKIIYIIGAILITLGGLAMIIGGVMSPFFAGLSLGLGGVLGGLAMITLGNLGWRLVCEAIIVIFSLHERLVSIDNKTKSPTQENIEAPKPTTNMCTDCKKVTSSEAKFCPDCGKKLAE